MYCITAQAPIHKEKEGSEKEADAQSCMLSNPIAWAFIPFLLILFLQYPLAYSSRRRALHGHKRRTRRIARARALA